MNLFRASSILFFSLQISSSVAAGSAPPSEVPGLPIDRAREHSKGIYRGARPEEVGTEALSRFGIRTVINLEDDAAQVAREKKQAEELGMDFISSPMTATETPNDDQVNQLLEWVESSSTQPVYLHCHYGKDRTGLIMGLHRVLFQGWDAARAYKEMRDVGFNPFFTKLKKYFKKRTNSKILDQKDLAEFFPGVSDSMLNPLSDD